jgi:hypothetical protein
LMHFFSFLYEKLCKESGNTSDITLYVRYLTISSPGVRIN